MTSQMIEQDKIAAIREFGLTVTATKTTPTRAGKQPKDVWEISGVNMRKYESILRDDMGLKMWKGKFTAWEDPTDELLELLQSSEAMSVEEIQEYAAERSEARAERLEERADKHAELSNQAFERSRNLVAGIPMGQPILVGHHSEKRHRKTLEKSDNAMRKSVDEFNYSKELVARASGAERNAKTKSVETCSLEYAGNRLKEAQAEFNRCDRELNLHLNCDVWYRGSNEAFTGKKGEIIALTTTHCNLSFLPPDGVSSFEWEYPCLKVVPITEIEMIIHPNCKLDLENRKQNAEEAIAFWQDVIKQKGGDRFSKDAIKKGDFVNYWGGWSEVVRVNKKSVSVKTPYSWTDTVEYTKLKGHKTAEQWKAIQEGKE